MGQDLRLDRLVIFSVASTYKAMPLRIFMGQISHTLIRFAGPGRSRFSCGHVAGGRGEEGAFGAEREPQLSRHHPHPQLKMSGGLSSELCRLRKLSSLRTLGRHMKVCSANAQIVTKSAAEDSQPIDAASSLPPGPVLYGVLAPADSS